MVTSWLQCEHKKGNFKCEHTTNDDI